MAQLHITTIKIVFFGEFVKILVHASGYCIFLGHGMPALPIGNLIPEEGERTCKENNVKCNADYDTAYGMRVEQYIVDAVSHGLNKWVGLVSEIKDHKEHKACQKIDTPDFPAIFAQKSYNH